MVPPFPVEMLSRFPKVGFRGPTMKPAAFEHDSKKTWRVRPLVFSFDAITQKCFCIFAAYFFNRKSTEKPQLS